MNELRAIYLEVLSRAVSDGDAEHAIFITEAYKRAIKAYRELAKFAERPSDAYADLYPAVRR